MVRVIKSSQLISVPKDVQLTVDRRVVSVKGVRGSLKKDFTHVPIDLRFDEKKNAVVADMWFGKQIQVAAVKSVLSHIRNMIIGVRQGFRYRMRFAYAHFPVSVTVEGSDVCVRNFLGEKYVRKVPLLGETSAKRTDTAVMKDELVLEGIDITHVAQTAAAVHGACLVKRKDIRKFLDGIYVSATENIVEQ